MLITTVGPGFDKSDPAFHREESFFFNLKFFNDLHSEAVMVKSEPATALIYWFMAMCHALASNISNDPSKHSMHLASLATEFWIPMCRVLPPAVIYPSLSDLLQATKIN